MKGNVKWFDPRKGYGYITDGGETEYFVYYSNIHMDGFRTLKQGAEVTFEIDTDDRGRVFAYNVVKVAEA